MEKHCRRVIVRGARGQDMQAALPIRDRGTREAAVSSWPPCLDCSVDPRAGQKTKDRPHSRIGVSSFEGLIARLSWSIPANVVFPRRLGHLHDTHFGNQLRLPTPWERRACEISHHPPRSDPITAAAVQPPSPTRQTKRGKKSPQLAPLKRPCISSALGTVQGKKEN